MVILQEKDKKNGTILQISIYNAYFLCYNGTATQMNKVQCPKKAYVFNLLKTYAPFSYAFLGLLFTYPKVSENHLCGNNGAMRF